MNESFYILTLGCKVNQYETQAMRESWKTLGWKECPFPEKASVLVVNSCAVTSSAVADVRANIRRLNKTCPNGKIIVTGCCAQVLTKEMAALPGVIACIPSAGKGLFSKNPSLFLQENSEGPITISAYELHGESPAQTFAQTSGQTLAQASAQTPAQTPGNTHAPFPPFEISGYPRARAVLKVQDGCSHRCTYCIVPLARGPSRSRPAQEILLEASRLLQAGFKEIVLSGINLRQYKITKEQSDAPPLNFWQLVKWLERELSPAWAGKARLRISSLEPGQLGSEALDILAGSRMICPHLHISLQSGSKAVLKRMGRGHYDPDTLKDFCGNLQKIWPTFGLGADFLVGFPEENELEFEETLNLARELPFSYGHVFPFSPRPGTPAASLPQVPKTIRTARAACLRELLSKKKKLFLRKFTGEAKSCISLPLPTLPPLHVILENTETALGFSEFYTECVVHGLSAEHRAKDLLRVSPQKVDKEKLIVFVSE